MKILKLLEKRAEKRRKKYSSIFHVIIKGTRYQMENYCELHVSRLRKIFPSILVWKSSIIHMKLSLYVVNVGSKENWWELSLWWTSQVFGSVELFLECGRDLLMQIELTNVHWTEFKKVSNSWRLVMRVKANFWC